MTIDSQAIIQRNIVLIEQQVREACRLAGRDRNEVTIVAVSKYVDWPLAAQVVASGLTVLGENRPQELWRKADAATQNSGKDTGGASVTWHLIGHLQTNKLKRTLPLVSLIHSIDSWRLLAATNAVAEELGLASVPVLLEVNISGDQAKHGFAEAELPSVLGEAQQLPHVRIDGLMGMAGLAVDGAQNRAQFRQLRELRDRLQQSGVSATELQHLSMGMSHDFPLAIQEGATLVRIGSAIFSGIDGFPTTNEVPLGLL